MKYFLLIRSATSQGRLALGDEAVTIGRHSSNVLKITDPRMSRYHCVIEKTPEGSIRLVDLGSRNGTWLNKHKLPGPTILTPGDVVQIGGVAIKLMLEAPEDLPVAELAQPVETLPEGPSKVYDDPNAVIHLNEEDVAPDPPSASPKKPATKRDVPDALAPPPGAVQLDADDESDDDDVPSEAVAASTRSINQVVAALPTAPLTPADLMLVNARNQRFRRAKGDGADDSAGGITVLKQLLVLCAKSGASDIHVEPKRDDTQVRIRVDGMMVEAVRLHAGVANRLIGVVRILCDLDITQKNAVQDGHFSAEAPDRRIDYRVSFTPSMHGQKLVIRVLDQAISPQRIDDLQLPPWMGENIRTLMKQDSGMLIVCGPTGSGKTTSLYAAIRAIDAEMRNIITIEDPPEYQIDGVTQIPINEQQGNTFSTLLRSVLRQDPDVILLGEIRDPETARIALQAAMTGHLVLSTVHARDTMGTIFRLLDLGVEPYLIASALNLVLSQRLGRKLCPHCKMGVAPKPPQVMKMGRFGTGLSKIYFPAGCPKCLNTGYHGRMGVYELLTTNAELRDVILKQPTMQELRKAINMELFNSLRESGYRLVAEGVTSLDEIDRVMGAE